MPTVEEILGSEAAGLLQHQCKTIAKESLHLPGPDFVERIHLSSNRPVAVLGKLQSLFDHGRLAGTGYVSILPVDQGIEHSAGASFAPNPLYFDPENIVKLAIEGGCNAVASTLGVLGMCARKYAHKIPFILKFNHNEFISYPNSFDQIRFASVKQALRHGRGRRRRDDLFRLGGIEAADPGSHRDVPARARARHVHGAVVLPPQLRVQDQGRRLPSRRRSHRPGQSPRRHDRSRHHQAEAARDQRRLQRDQLRQDAQEGLLGSVERSSDRPDALPARQLLHGPRGPDQFRRRLVR